jgi:hypothetical protein
MAADGRPLAADGLRARTATRAGLASTATWIGVASVIVLVNAAMDPALTPTALGATIVLSALPVVGIVGRWRGLRGPGEWRRAVAVMAGVILAGLALVALVMAIWGYLTFGPPGR